MKQVYLDIDVYADGLNVYDYNCMDIPLAAACGTYRKENYYNYIIQLCAEANWVRYDGKTRNMFDCLRLLGLKREPITVASAEELLPKVKEEIKAGRPVLLPVLYAEMFFCPRYKKYYAAHYLLVYGYDEELGMIYLREELSAISTTKLKDVKGMYPLRLRQSMLEEIWVNSQKYIEKSFQGRFFVIQPTGENSLQTGADMVEYLLKQYDFEKSRFLAELSDNSMTQENVDLEIREFRNRYDKNMNALFHMLAVLVKGSIQEELYSSFLKFKKAYMEVRTVVIAKLHLSILKGKQLDIDKIAEQTTAYDRQLKELLMRIHRELKKPEIAQEKTEAWSCKVTTSSCENAVYSCGENVLTDDLRIWKSQTADEAHWICFDFGEPRTVHEIIITHHPEAHKLTKDFSIQKSMDGVVWETVEAIENNLLPQTRHMAGDKSGRFWRIYITMPALNRKAAILRHVCFTGKEAGSIQ